MNLSYKFIHSPIGGLKLVASDEGLAAVLWENDNPRRVRLGNLIENPEHPILLRVERELNEYFRGKRKGFTVPLDMRGTHFQKQAHVIACKKKWRRILQPTGTAPSKQKIENLERALWEFSEQVRLETLNRNENAERPVGRQ